MRVDRIQGKKVGVIGAARSGEAAALLLKRYGADVFVSDSKPANQIESAIEQLEKNSIPYEAGGNTEAAYKDRDYIIVSPGVPPLAPVMKEIESSGIPIISELELGWWMCDGNIAAITGSNGKTTTTTLTGEMFKTAGIKAFVAGNIGYPFCAVCDQVSHDGWVVLEVSSFQLEKCYEFRPNIAVVLNLTPDHLDRYGDFNTYSKMKMLIGDKQTESDSLVVNYDDDYLTRLSALLPGRKFFFSIAQAVSPGVSVISGEMFYRTDHTQKKIMDVSDIKLPGPHNLSNAAAACTIGVLANLPFEAMEQTLKTFSGVEHRLEDCGTVDGVRFINDSKATNVDSVWYALQSVEGKLVTIMGGRDKKGDFQRLEKLVAGNVNALVLIGEAADKLEKAFGSIVPVRRAENMNEAVAMAFTLAGPSGTVLLSPACASFDMFDDFEHRGRAFKQSVDNLRKR